MTQAARLQQPLFQFASTALTHPGGVRALNEDRLLDIPSEGFWAVADGMGGHQSGEAAASRLIDALNQVEHGRSGFSRLSDVTRVVEAVNAALFENAVDTGLSGSTLAALLVHEGHYACLWAGDSRAYLFRNGQLAAITRDHSVVQQLIDDGVLSEGSRREHPNANVITRAIGAASEIVLEQRFAPIMEGDRFLLCSDGLNVCVDDQAIANVLGEAREAAADHLMALAMAQGAPDNVSVIVVDVHR